MFQGTGTALITPFNEDGSVDYAGFKTLVEDQIAGGVSALIILGTTGEAAVINEEERRMIIGTVVSQVDKRIKVIVGTGSNDTYTVAKYNKIAEEYDVDGLLIVNPYYNKSTQEGLIQHFKYISDRTKLPIILYNVPSRTGMNILPETVIKIHQECKNIVAVKEASGDISQIAKLCSIAPETLTVFSGNDDQTLPIMSLGAKGVISVFSNVFPKEMSELTKAILEKNYDKALEIHNKCLRIMNILFIETSPIPVKYAAYLRGLCKNSLRLPLVPLTASSEERLKEELSNFSGL